MDTECPFCGVDFETDDKLDAHFVDGCPMDDETSFSDQSSSLEVCCVSGDEEEVSVAPFDFHFTPRYPT